MRAALGMVLAPMACATSKSSSTKIVVGNRRFGRVKQENWCIGAGKRGRSGLPQGYTKEIRDSYSDPLLLYPVSKARQLTFLSMLVDPTLYADVTSDPIEPKNKWALTDAARIWCISQNMASSALNLLSRASLQWHWAIMQKSALILLPLCAGSLVARRTSPTQATSIELFERTVRL